MDLKYLWKEAKYYKRLDGNLKRVFWKFLFYKTPLSRLVNTGLYNYFYNKKIEKFTKEHRPTILQIENTNLCNAKCVMCPHSTMKRKQKIMNFVDFKKIVDKILPNYPSIKLLVITGFGEPLLDRDIIEKIKYVNHKYPQIKIDLYTNGALLRKEIAEELLKTHIHKINFSINALQKDYKEIMGLDYPTVENNILYFTEKKKSLKKIFPLVNFSLMILKKNAEDTKKFIDLWKTRGDSVMTYMPLEWAGDKKVETIAEVKMNKKRWACIPLWQNIMVDVNGDIIMCCQDYESKVKFGNVLNESIKKIMNSEKFIKIREMQKKGIYNMPLCDSCDNWVNSSFSWWHYN